MSREAQHQRHRDGVLLVVAEHLFGGEQAPDAVGAVPGDAGQLAVGDQAVAEGALLLEVRLDLAYPVDGGGGIGGEVVGPDDRRHFGGVRRDILAKSAPGQLPVFQGGGVGHLDLVGIALRQPLGGHGRVRAGVEVEAGRGPGAVAGEADAGGPAAAGQEVALQSLMVMSRV